MKIIDYNAIVENAVYFKKAIGDAKLCAVIKNDAYGHGLIHTARYLSTYVDMFAVGSLSEAEEIAYLNKNVLILLPQDFDSTVICIKRNYLLTVDSINTLDIVIKAAKKVGKPARIHIKIDSGMSRLGFRTEEIRELTEKIYPEAVEVCGVYSHFYGNDNESRDRQLKYFLNCCDILEKKLKRKLLKHIANTSAALASDKYHLDMVRVGLGLYGYGNANLSPAKSVTASVIAVRRVKSGCVAGYDAVFHTERDCNLAIINKGYAHGLARSLIGSKVKLNGRFYSIVAICMAMSILNLENDVASIGDTAQLLGKDVNIANNDVIVYELLCNLQ